MEKDTINQISKNIKKYRLLHQMTQETLATELHLDTQYYAQLECFLQVLFGKNSRTFLEKVPEHFWRKFVLQNGESSSSF